MSFSFADNEFVQSASGVSRSNSITANGLFNYVPVDGTISLSDSLSFVPSFQMSAAGNWDRPIKQFGDTSALKIGETNTFAYYTPLTSQLPVIFLQAFPYYQTDFYEKARAEGATLSLLPVVPSLWIGQPREHLAGTIDPLGFADIVFLIRGEASYLNVENSGQTNLLQKTYMWLGGAARAYVTLFPKLRQDQFSYIPDNWLPYIEDRVLLTATYKGYVDVTSGRIAHLLSASGQYRLTCVGTDCIGGTTSIGLQYDYGVDRDILQKQKKFRPSCRLRIRFRR